MDYAKYVSRATPQLPPGAMQTFEVDAPLETHWRRATCEEVECAAYTQGWSSDVPPDSDGEIRIKQIYDNEIRRGKVTTTKTPEGFIRYHFPAGTECFRRIWHRLPLEREATFTLRSGDYRGTDGIIRTFKDGPEWVDAFATHQDNIAQLVDRG